MAVMTMGRRGREPMSKVDTAWLRMERSTNLMMISGFRWSFYGVSDVQIEISLAAILGFLTACILTARWMILSGYRLKR